MPECVVCKGYYEVDQSCKEVEQLCKEAEQRRKKVEQRCKEARQCYQEAKHRCKEAELRRKEAEQLRKKAEQLCKEARQRYQEAQQHCEEAEQEAQETQHRYEEAEQPRKEARQRYQEAELHRKEAEQLRKKAEQRCEEARQRYQEAQQRYEEAEQEAQETQHRYEEAEQRYKKAGRTCKRCDSDNSDWEEWRRSEPVEQGGFQGLRYFTEPHVHVPFLIVIAALGLGLMGIAGLWQGINLAARLLATVATVGGCLVVIQGVYEGRHALRETEMLAQVRPRKPGKGIYIRLNAQLKTILMPALIVALVILLAYALVQSDALWKLADWLLLEREEKVPPPPSDEVPEEENPVEPPPDEFRERVKRALPLLFMFGYVGFCLSLAYSSSMMLARKYVKRMNEVLPHPIFVQTEKLAEIVRQEAEVELGRLAPESTNASWMGYVQVEEQINHPLLLPPSTGVPVEAGIPLSQRIEGWGQGATWVWDELARMDDGGIEMKVARHEIYQLPEPTDKPEHHPHPRVRYTVRADRWGRIVEIKRDVEQTK